MKKIPPSEHLEAVFEQIREWNSQPHSPDEERPRWYDHDVPRSYHEAYPGERVDKIHTLLKHHSQTESAVRRALRSPEDLLDLLHTYMQAGHMICGIDATLLGNALHVLGLQNPRLTFRRNHASARA